MQQIRRPFVLETIYMPFKRPFVLWYALTHQIVVSYSNLHFYTSYTYFSQFLHFSHTNFTPIFFFVCITPHGIFLLSLMMPLISARLEFNLYMYLWLRPRSKNILRSNVYSFYAVEFTMKHKSKIVPIYHQSFKEWNYSKIECA